MRFRFTIRALLLLTLVVALAVAWYASEKKWIADRHAAMNAPRHGYLSVTSNVFLHWWKKGDAPWHLRLLGERQGYSKIQLGRDKDTEPEEQQQAIAKMKSFFPEADVYVIVPPW